MYVQTYKYFKMQYELTIIAAATTTTTTNGPTSKSLIVFNLPNCNRRNNRGTIFKNSKMKSFEYFSITSLKRTEQRTIGMFNKRLWK